jgi:hypothetical protein
LAVSFTISPYPRLLTFLTLLFGAFVFVWLGTEEDSVWLVSLLGLGISLLATAHAIFRLSGRTFPPRVWIMAAVALGALIGAGAVAGTILLMLMKTSMHSHIFPDYSFPLISGIFERLPTWILAGALFGLASALLIYRPLCESD